MSTAVETDMTKPLAPFAATPCPDGYVAVMPAFPHRIRITKTQLAPAPVEPPDA